MILNKYNRKEAQRHIAAADPVLGAVIERCGPCTMEIRRENDLFLSLSRSITYQQLTGKAAETIFQRFNALFADSEPNAEAALSLELQQLRSVGLSQNKSLSILDLAEKTHSKSIPSRRRLMAMSDEDVIDTLCQVRGIGPWTAQMFLMFNIGRPDVMPATDLGIQKGIKAVYSLETRPTPEEVQARSAIWRPYCSVASWYLWLVADVQLLDESGTA